MLIKIVVGFFVLGLIFWVGWSMGSNAETKRRVRKDLEFCKTLVEFDRAFLASLPARMNTITSGRHVLETQFAGEDSEVEEFHLDFIDGKMVSRALSDLRQTGNVVSWKHYDHNEGPAGTYVGLIDGEIIWGRVVRNPGQGWHQGEPPSFGVWKMYSQPGESELVTTSGSEQ